MLSINLPLYFIAKYCYNSTSILPTALCMPNATSNP